MYVINTHKFCSHSQSLYDLNVSLRRSRLCPEWPLKTITACPFGFVLRKSPAGCGAVALKHTDLTDFVLHHALRAAR